MARFIHIYKLLYITMHPYIRTYIRRFIHIYMYGTYLGICGHTYDNTCNNQCISHVQVRVSSAFTHLSLCCLVSVQQNRNNCHWYIPLHSAKQHNGTNTAVQEFLWTGCHLGIQWIIHFWLHTGYRHALITNFDFVICDIK